MKKQIVNMIPILYEAKKEHLIDENGKVITPDVSRINIAENIGFLLIDEIKLMGNIQGNLYFYVDNLGNPIGEAITDICQTKFPITYIKEDLTTYKIFKEQVINEVNKKLACSFIKLEEQLKGTLEEANGLKK